jgi:hypothetical protein
MKNIKWLGFTPGTSLEDARRRYVERYGEEPREVKVELHLVLAGPIPEVEAKT